MYHNYLKERIPERVVHARSFGIHGYFETYESLADVTCADMGEATFVKFHWQPKLGMQSVVRNDAVKINGAETEQVAFCTQNIIRGIETEDPLLQGGRNFCSLDTQIKRLGSPNFTHIPINAPKCPVHHFHQDGHMACIIPTEVPIMSRTVMESSKSITGKFVWRASPGKD